MFLCASQVDQWRQFYEMTLSFSSIEIKEALRIVASLGTKLQEPWCSFEGYRKEMSTRVVMRRRWSFYSRVRLSLRGFRLIFSIISSILALRFWRSTSTSPGEWEEDESRMDPSLPYMKLLKRSAISWAAQVEREIKSCIMAYTFHCLLTHHMWLQVARKQTL